MLKVQPRLFTVDEYHAMGEAGILGPDERVELIEGELISMSPIGIRHAATDIRLNELLNKLYMGRALVSVQNPLLLGEHSEPEPDIVLLKHRDDYYARALLAAADVLLCIEVSDTTIAYDRDVKGPLYARAGIAEYWLVNLVDNAQQELVFAVEVHRQPVNGDYQQQARYPHAGELTLPAPAAATIAVAELLG